MKGMKFITFEKVNPKLLEFKNCSKVKSFVVKFTRIKNNDNFKIILIISLWVVISLAVVVIAILAPDLIFMFIPSPVKLSTPTTFKYADVIGWCLNSLFSTALVLIGAAQILKVHEEKDRSKNERS